MNKNGRKNLIRKIRIKGLGTLSKRAALFAVSKVYLDMNLYVIIHDLSEDIPEVSCPEGFMFKELKKDEVSRLLSFAGKTRVEKFKRRAELGMRCFAVTRNGTVANFFWCSLSDVEDDILHIRIPVGKGEAYSFDTMTKPEFRHRGFFFSLLICHLHILKSMGIRRAVAVHSARDVVNVYPKYLEAGIPARIVKVIHFRRFLFWTDEQWTLYNGHLGLEPGTHERR